MSGLQALIAKAFAQFGIGQRRADFGIAFLHHRSWCAGGREHAEIAGYVKSAEFIKRAQADGAEVMGGCDSN